MSDREDLEQRRAERRDNYQRDVAALEAALTAAGIDPTDLSRFVNRVVPGVIEPSNFDAAAAVPILLDWLPRVQNEHVKETIARRLKTPSAKTIATLPLTEQFRIVHDPSVKWAIGETLRYVADRSQYDQLVELAADPAHGQARGMLVDMLWRVKTDRADQTILAALDQPGVYRSAMSAARRRFGNDLARRYIAPLLDHPDAGVRKAAGDQLKRIDRASDPAT